MGKNLLVLAVLSVSLAVAGCEQNQRRPAAVAEPVTPSPTSTTMTLSAEQMMALDWNGRDVERSKILDKRVVGQGIEMDIRFPGNTPGPCSIDHTSSGTAGRRALVGIDVERFEAFALKFSLISVNAHCDPNIPLEIAAGAVIGPAGDGRYAACDPVMLDLSAEKASVVASTAMNTERIRIIGIHVNVVNPLAWDVNGGILTVRVEPAPDAEILPMPAVAEKEEAAGTKSARTPGNKGREESPAIPTFGSTRVGAW